MRPPKITAAKVVSDRVLVVGPGGYAVSWGADIVDRIRRVRPRPHESDIGL